MTLLVWFMLLVLSLFGVSPDNGQLHTHVWGAVSQPITVDNVALYADTVVSVPYSRFDSADQFDTCGIWLTVIRFDDGTQALQLERDCQVPYHSYLAVYQPTIDGMRYVEY